MEQPLIFVSGAGPTGLFFAHEMIKRGHHLRIIDRKAHPSKESKACVIHSRTIEILDQAGIADQFLERSYHPKGMSIHVGSHKQNIDFSILPSPFPFPLLIPQGWSEEILYHHLQAVGGEVEWNTELTHLENGECTLKKKDGSEEKIRPDWIIGADGGRSKVRESNHIPFIGNGFDQLFVLFDIEGDFDHPTDRLHVFFEYKDPIALIPLPPNLFRVVFIAESEAEKERSNYTPTFLMEALHKRGVKLTKIKSLPWSSVFKIRTCVAQTMRKGRSFLMGDAAHIHSPLGGQGMNMSLHDAYNLSWKLDLVINGLAPDRLLDTYSEERLPIVSKTTRMTEFATGALFKSLHLLNPIRTGLIRLMSSLPKFHHALPLAVSQLTTHYRHSSIVFQPTKDRKWKGPRPGERAPFARLSDGRGIFDLFQEQKHLILFFSEHQELKEALSGISKWVNCCMVTGEEVRKIYAASPETLYVIRPDGYIGYRSSSGDLEGLRDYFSKVFAVPSRSHCSSC